MKASFKSGHGRRPLAIISPLAFAVCLLGIGSDAAKGAPTTNATEVSSGASPTDYNNWITLGAGGMLTSGDRAQAEHQRQIPNSVFGGVEDFHWQEFVGKKGLFQVDGHGIFDNHDYSIRMELADPDKGFVRGGYTESRTWYDGNGGFFPGNGQWFSLYDNELHVDRGDAWFEAGLTLPDKPVITFRFDHEFREGDKDSTSWGDTTLTGATPPNTTRKIVPTFLGIDETRDIFQADIKHTLGNTDLGLGLRYEIDHTSDSTYIRLNPGEANNRFVTQNDGEQNDLFNVHGFTQTHFNKRVTFSLGGSFTTIDTDLSGSRIYGPSYNAPYSAVYPNNGSGFINLTGGGNTKDYVGNMNLMLTPFDNLVLVPAFRVEYQGGDLSDNFGSTTAATQTPTAEANNNWYLDVAESLEVRYTGLRNWSFYTSGEWSEDSGNEVWNQATTIFTPLQNQDWTRLGQKYTVGANWYPLSRLNFGAQYYYQVHNYDFDNNLAATPITYPGYLRNQDFTMHDMNIRATWRAFDTLSLVTRYDFQYSTVDTTSFPNNGTIAGPSTEVQSANITSQIISESLSWTPLSRLYVQATFSYALYKMNTPAQSWMGANDIVPNLADDYWTVNAMAGYALDNKTDLQLQYSYYRAADNVNNASFSEPYGANTEEQSVTATITRQITKAIAVSLKYGFFRNQDDTSGGHNNYDAHLVYASMQYRF